MGQVAQAGLLDRLNSERRTFRIPVCYEGAAEATEVEPLAASASCFWISDLLILVATCSLISGSQPDHDYTLTSTNLKSSETWTKIGRLAS